MNGLFSTVDWVNYLVFPMFLVAGSMISLWIADEITMKGVGNGTSVLIFVGVVSRIPEKILQGWSWLVPMSDTGEQMFVGIMSFIFYFIIALLLVLVIVFFEKSERRIPIQQTGKGLQLVEEKQNYLPVKVNPSGIIPVIFAAAIMTLPPIIAQFFPADSQARYWIITNFSLTAPLGLSLYAILIVLFTFFYAHINIKADEISENFQKSSSFIIGVKPGKETEDYIFKTITALSVYGALILTSIAILPYLLSMWGLPQSIAFGGTAMIITVSVSIDIYDQLHARIIAAETKTREVSKVKKYLETPDVLLDDSKGMSDIPLFE